MTRPWTRTQQDGHVRTRRRRECAPSAAHQRCGRQDMRGSRTASQSAAPALPAPNAHHRRRPTVDRGAGGHRQADEPRRCDGPPASWPGQDVRVGSAWPVHPRCRPGAPISSPGFDQGWLPVGGRGEARVMAFLAARPAQASWAASHTPEPALVSASRLDAGRCAAGSRRAPRHRAPATIPPPGRGLVPAGQRHHQRVGDLPCDRQQISGPLFQLPDAVQHDAQIEPPAHHLIVALLVTVR